LAGVHPEDRAAFLASRGSATAGTTTAEYRLRRHDGEYRWIQETRAPRCDEPGVVVGYAGICADVTDQRLAAGELARARDDALESARMKSGFWPT
jgi:PAS domain S-box-containing protein